MRGVKPLSLAAVGRPPLALRRATLGLTLVLCTGMARAGRAQSVVPPSTVSPPCSYRSCALRIEPAWNGLALARGNRTRAGNLNFFWPHDVTPVLRGGRLSADADSAAAHAGRAITLRRRAAFFTDVGLALAAVGVTRAALRGRASRADETLAAAGLGALTISVPLQFAADGALSRAVWWHNIRYAP